jgi:hypothetical protein
MNGGEMEQDYEQPTEADEASGLAGERPSDDAPETAPVDDDEDEHPPEAGEPVVEDD